MASSPSAGARRLGSPRASCHAVADVTTGDGLLRALAGADAVIDGTNSQRDAAGVLVAGTRRVLAIAHEAGVRHFVGVSLVGIDDAPIAYCRVKAAQEKAIAEGPVPWSLLRATQFHELVEQFARGRWGVVLAPRGLAAPADRRARGRRGARRDGPGRTVGASARRRRARGGGVRRPRARVEDRRRPPPPRAPGAAPGRDGEVPAFGADVQHRPRRGHRHVRRLAGRALPHVAGHS